MKENKKTAVLLVLTYCISSATLASLIKFASIHIPITQILFVAYLIGLILLIPLLLKNAPKHFFRSNTYKTQIGKAIFGVMQVGFLMMALTYMPTANALILRNTSPLWVPILCYLLFRREFQRTSWVAILIGFVGVLVLLHPDMHQYNIGAGLALFAGLSLALSSVLTRILHQKHEPIYRTLFYTFLVPVILLAFWQPGHWQTLNWNTTLILIIIGVILFITVYFYTKSFAYAPAVFIAPLSYLTFIVAGIYDWLIWHHTPSMLNCYGAAIILCSCYLNIRRSAKTKPIDNA